MPMTCPGSSKSLSAEQLCCRVEESLGRPILEFILEGSPSRSSPSVTGKQKQGLLPSLGKRSPSVKHLRKLSGHHKTQQPRLPSHASHTAASGSSYSHQLEGWMVAMNAGRGSG